MPEVARASGVPRRSVQSVLDGHVPSLVRAAKICDALGLELYIGPAGLVERAELGKRLAQLYLTWRYPQTFGGPDLADPDRRQELDREVEQVASELVALHRRGEPRALDASDLKPVAPPRPAPPSPPSPVEGVNTARDRRLAELLAALVRHWEALGTRYARNTWIADVYRWCPPLRAQRRRQGRSAGG